MQAHIDKFGRIVIPKTFREHFGLTTGSIVHLEEGNNVILLKVINTTPPIKMENGIAVFTGKAIDNIETSIKEERENRLKKLGGF